MGKSKIIVFANQKGGVGKSTLCISYAHYLATVAGILVGAIIDCDIQQTVSKQRETDLKTYGENQYTYFQVVTFSLDNHSAIPDIVKSLRQTEDMVYLFDTPGTIQSQGLLSLLTLADAIICPFHFDRKTVASTATFIKFVEKIKDILRQSNPDINIPLFLLPNMADPRIGTVEEKVLWEEVRTEFAKFGSISPDIPRRVSLERCSTLTFLDNQSELVKPAYDFINNTIFDHGDNIKDS